VEGAREPVRAGQMPSGRPPRRRCYKKTPDPFFFAPPLFLRRALRGLRAGLYKPAGMLGLGATEEAARHVAANLRRWWKHAAKPLNTAQPTSSSDRLGVPRRVCSPQPTEPPDADPHVRVVWEGSRGGSPAPPMPIYFANRGCQLRGIGAAVARNDGGAVLMCVAEAHEAAAHDAKRCV
jgi:hypothetical protein